MARNKTTESKPFPNLAERIQRSCLQRGWNRGELAQRSGVSRTTLYQLERGGVTQPRASTLKQIADALSVPVSELVGSIEPGPYATPAIQFDRATNSCIDEVSEDCPNLFSGWSPAEWDELYSTFGVGGQLSSEGVVQSAISINRKREVVQRLGVVLETHLRDVAAGLIDLLYDQVNAVPRAAEPSRRCESA